jgi:hypothetical protein
VHDGFEFRVTKTDSLCVCFEQEKKKINFLSEEYVYRNVSFDKVFTSPHHVQEFSKSLFCFVTRVL